MPDAAALLRAYDDEVRDREPGGLPTGAVVERDGPLYRAYGMSWGGFVGYRDLTGLEGAALDALIARQRDFFAARGERVEWKYHGHDAPADLPDRLRAAGFVPEDRETVVIGDVADLAGDPALPPGVRLREVSAPAELARIARMEEAVWGDDRSWLPPALAGEIAADARALTIVVAEAGDLVVSAGWVRYGPGRFASLWGGSTLVEWRKRGIYRALVAYRAGLAAARGLAYLQVDASEDSRPILQRLGMTAVTTTTPYVFEPEVSAAPTGR